MTKIETIEQYEWAMARVEQLLPLVEDITCQNSNSTILT